MPVTVLAVQSSCLMCHMLLQALAAMQPEPSGRGTGGMQAGWPSPSRKRRSGSQPSSPASPTAEERPAPSAGEPVLQSVAAMLSALPETAATAGPSASTPAAAATMAQGAPPACEAPRPANVIDLTGPLDFPFSVPSMVDPHLSVYQPGISLSPAVLGMAPELDRAERGADPGSMLGLSSDPPATPGSPYGVATTPPEPSTVSSMSQLEAFRNPSHSGQPMPAVPAVAVSSRPGLIIQVLQLQATRQLSMSPSTTSAAFPYIFPESFDARQRQFSLSPGGATAVPRSGRVAPVAPSPITAAEVQIRQNPLSPSTPVAAMPTGLPSQVGAPVAASLPVRTAAQHHHHFHHHHHHLEQLPPFLEDAIPGGSALSQVQNRRAELEVHGIPITSPQTIQRRIGADDLSEMQDRRAERELHAMPLGSQSGTQTLTGRPTRDPPRRESHGRHLGQQPTIPWPPDSFQPSFLGPTGPPSQQAAQGTSQVQVSSMLQSSHLGQVRVPSQQAGTSMPQEGHQPELDPFWRAIPSLVEATDFSDDAPALSRGDMGSLFGDPQVMGFQATVPSSTSRLSRTPGAEVSIPGMGSSGQSTRGPPPLEGRPVGFPMHPGFPSMGGIPHGNMASGRAQGPAYPPEQPAMQRARPTQPGLPREANLLFGGAERPAYPPEQAAVLRANLGQPGLQSQFTLELPALVVPGSQMVPSGWPSRFSLESLALGMPGPQMATSGLQQALQLRRPYPHGALPPGTMTEQAYQVSWCTESGIYCLSIIVCLSLHVCVPSRATSPQLHTFSAVATRHVGWPYSSHGAHDRRHHEIWKYYQTTSKSRVSCTTESHSERLISMVCTRPQWPQDGLDKQSINALSHQQYIHAPAAGGTQHVQSVKI